MTARSTAGPTAGPTAAVTTGMTAGVAPGVTASEDGCLDVPWSVLEDYRCFGCSPHNPQGMQLRFREHPDGLVTTFRLGRTHESYPGVVHGGLIGVVCDETMGNLIVLRTGLTAFTTALRLRYLAPIAVGAVHDCVARILDSPSSQGSRSSQGPSPQGLVHADAQILDADGNSVATARATYRPVPFDVARNRLTLTAGEADRLHEALATTTHEEA